MDNGTDILLHSVFVTSLSMSACEGVVAVILNIIYIVVFSIRPRLRNQSNSLNVGLALSSMELALGIIMLHFVNYFPPNQMHWQVFYYQVCFPLIRHNKFHKIFKRCYILLAI